MNDEKNKFKFKMLQILQISFCLTFCLSAYLYLSWKEALMTYLLSIVMVVPTAIGFVVYERYFKK